jgi:hypothetical protein
MQIHELNRPRRTNEGAGWDAIKTSVSNAVADATGQDRQANAASAGILDPKQKLAAVMKEPQMVKLATQYADEWLKDPRSKVQAQAQAVPEDTAVAPGTYNKKTGAAKLGGKTMTALSDLPPAVQQQIQAKQQELEKQTGQPNPSTVPTKPAAGTPAPNTINAPGFNYNNVMKMPGMEKYATPATATNTSAQTPPATGSQVNKAKPDNPNIKDQTRYVQGRAGSGTGGDATKFAKYDPATSAVANAGQGINNMVRGGVAAQQLAAPAKATGTAMPLKPYQVPGAGTNPNPTKPGQPATTTPAPATGTPMPLKPYQVPGAGTDPNPTTQPVGATKPQIPAATPNNYMDDFEAWANQKTAMRDSTTYRTIGLADVKNTTQKENLKAELAAARQAVDTAKGNPTETKEAVKNYILTVLAGAQLIASQNKVAAASTQPPAAQQAPKTAAANTVSGAGQTNAANAAQPIDINALLKSAGLDPVALQKAATVMQKATRNNKLRATGDDAIDGMLGLMGYKVS